MYPILLCSIFSIAIAVERLLYYRSCSTQDGFLQGLKDLLGHGRYEEALSLSTQTKGDCADIAAFYLKDPGKKMDEVETRARHDDGRVRRKPHLPERHCHDFPAAGIAGNDCRHYQRVQSL
jgi:hypothetical protein